MIADVWILLKNEESRVKPYHWGRRARRFKKFCGFNYGGLWRSMAQASIHAGFGVAIVALSSSLTMAVYGSKENAVFQTAIPVEKRDRLYRQYQPVREAARERREETQLAGKTPDGKPARKQTSVTQLIGAPNDDRNDRDFSNATKDGAWREKKRHESSNDGTCGGVAGGSCTMVGAPSTVEEALEHARLVFGDQCQALPIEASRERNS